MKMEENSSNYLLRDNKKKQVRLLDDIVAYLKWKKDQVVMLNDGSLNSIHAL
jgi:predicted phosphatase